MMQTSERTLVGMVLPVAHVYSKVLVMSDFSSNCLVKRQSQCLSVIRLCLDFVLVSLQFVQLNFV